jgi:hypothetical protein
MENTTPTFSEGMGQEPKLTEVQKIQQRVANSRVLLSPAVAQSCLATVELALNSGLFKMADLDAAVQIREEITKGIIDHNTTVATAQKQLEQAQLRDQEELAKQLAEQREQERQQLVDERILRKTTQNRLAQMEAILLKAGVSIDLDGDGTIGLPAGVQAETLTASESEQVAEILKTEVPTPVLEPVVPVASSAMRLARSLNPVGAEQPIVPLDTPQSHTVIPSPVETNKPISENEEFVGQIEAAKKSFAEFVEPKEVILEPTTIIPEDANTSTEDFLEEVELVSTMDELDQFEQDLIDEEQFNASFENDQVEYEDELLDMPNVTEEHSTLDIGYETSKPVVSGGNAPNLKATVPTAPSVTAPVLGENDVVLKQSDIRVFEEDLTEPVEEEDEYEEISIPSPSELNVMTKSGILKEAEKLGFELIGTKNQMIEQFTEQTEAFIAQLQEDGEFLSASDTDGVDDDGDENNRDGGYF